MGQQVKGRKMKDDFRMISLECKLYPVGFVSTEFLAYGKLDGGK